jgi:pimeloyl-ACP methyl ester carboxylesterase
MRSPVIPAVLGSSGMPDNGHKLVGVFRFGPLWYRRDADFLRGGNRRRGNRRLGERHRANGAFPAWRARRVGVRAQAGSRSGRLALHNLPAARPAAVGADGPRTMAQNVADAIAVLDSRGVDRAVLAGHSFGAHFALHLAVAHPDRVAGLVLIDGLGVVDDGGLDEFGQAMTDRMLPQAAQRLRQIEDELGGREPDDEADREMFALEWPSYFVDPLTAPPFGAQSPMPVSQGEQTAALIAGAEVRIIPGCRTPAVVRAARLRRRGAGFHSGSAGATRLIRGQHRGRSWQAANSSVAGLDHTDRAGNTGAVVGAVSVRVLAG